MQSYRISRIEWIKPLIIQKIRSIRSIRVPLNLYLRGNGFPVRGNDFSVRGSHFPVRGNGFYIGIVGFRVAQPNLRFRWANFWAKAVNRISR
jgi:hypothetical protein